MLTPMQYEWILFDADETLFHFDSFAGLKLMFSEFGIDFGEEDYSNYQTINRPLWNEYQNGTITADQVQTLRFDHWSQKIGVPSQTLNGEFLNAMAKICAPLPGARELIGALKDKVQMGIITNGFTQLQRIRLDRTGMSDAFSVLVISEQVGVAKPDRGIFDHAFQLMNHPSREKVLMVGDNLHSDVVGGLNAGIHTCWVNNHGHDLPEGIIPHYQVRTLGELRDLLLGK